jgi:ankyrin repeat protein
LKHAILWIPSPVSTCASLLVVVNVDGSPVIQFAHFSVKEYLTSARPAKAKPRISRFHVSMKQAHTIVAQGCLGVLLHLGERPTEDSLKKFPLAEYAAEHWVGHAQFEDVVSNIQDGMKRLFEPSKRHLAAWAWIYDPVSPFRRHTRLECPSRAKATPLHYAAFGCMCNIIKFLIVERTQNPNARDYHRGETPLGVASREGRFEAARVLLEYGADTNSRDKDDWSPLDRASAEGHVEVARVLLEHGADVNAQEKSGDTALHQAAGFGAPAVAQVLLEHHADVNAQNMYERTPLHAASVHGYVEVVKVLLEHGADVDAKNISYRTPLSLASERGHLDVVHTLLEHGADVTAQGDNGETPLHLASREGYLDVVRLLLQWGSDVHAQNNRGWTSLQKASAEGHQDVMQLLLGHGAEEEVPQDRVNCWISRGSLYSRKHGGGSSDLRPPYEFVHAARVHHPGQQGFSSLQ